MKIISLEGLIGAGKTTLMKLLQDKLDSEITFLFEPIEEWQHVGGENLLDFFYKDPCRYGYLFQCRVLLTRIKQLQAMINSPNCKQTILIERSWFSDRMCFSKILYEDGIISEMEWVIYQEMFEWIQNFCPSINKYIYLQCSVERAFNGISQRNRKEENNIPINYLEKLKEKHEEWLLKEDVLIIDSDRNFITDTSYLNELVENIKDFIKDKELIDIYF